MSETNYEQIINVTYLSETYIHWSSSFASFNWSLYTFNYETCVFSAEKEMLVKFFTPMFEDESEIFIIKQAICSWDISTWDYTFTSFHGYMAEWFSFYELSFFESLYTSAISNFNLIIMKKSFEIVMVKIHMIFDIQSSCSSFVLTQDFTDAFTAIVDFTESEILELQTTFGITSCIRKRENNVNAVVNQLVIFCLKLIQTNYWSLSR
jgi:hypothetical protein